MGKSDKTTRIAWISANMLRAQGVTADISPRVAAALEAIDPDRVSSVPGTLRLLAESIEAANRDRELSPEGKRNRITAATSGRLGNLASLAKTIAKLEAEHRADTDAAVPLPKAEAADVILDLALVQYVREAKPIPSKLQSMSERVRVAVARTPVELSGLDGATQAKVRGSLMDPMKAVQLGAESAALDAARKTVQRAINDVGPSAGWTPKELVQHFGTDWELPGVIDTMAQRLSREQSGDSSDSGAEP